MIEVKFDDILDVPLCDAWEDFYDKYGVNEWCVKEGLVENDTTIKADIKDVKRWGIF